MNRYRDKITQNFNVKARLGNQAIDGLNLLPVAPPSDESVRDRRIGQVDRDRIIDDRPGYRRSR
jgi:hypothetical protein